MKMSILLAALIWATGAFADSYLYWMIDTTDKSVPSAYKYARIKEAGSGNYLTIYDGAFEEPYTDAKDSGSGVAKTYIDMAASVNDGFYADISGFGSSASFIVELYNDSNDFLAQSFKDGSYGAISSYIYHGGISTPPAVPWTAGSFDVPEPSSGLLMLLGMAGLALRRKRVV